MDDGSPAVPLAGDDKRRVSITALPSPSRSPPSTSGPWAATMAPAAASPYRRMSQTLQGVGGTAPSSMQRQGSIQLSRIIDVDPHIQARLSLDHDKMIRVLSERSRRRSSGVLHTRLGPGPASFPKTRTLATLEDEGGVSSPNLERKRTIRLHSSPPSSPMGSRQNLSVGGNNTSPESSGPSSTPTTPTTPTSASSIALGSMEEPSPPVTPTPPSAATAAPSNSTTVPTTTTAVVSDQSGEEEMLLEIVNGAPHVMAGTPVALLEHLTGVQETETAGKSGWLSRLNPRHSATTQAELEFQQCFLLTFHCFLSPHTLIEVIATQVTESGPDSKEFEKAMKVLRSWANFAASDFDDETLRQSLHSLLAKCNNSISVANEAASVKEVLAARLAREEEHIAFMQGWQSSEPSTVSFIMVAPEQLAEQLTLFDWTLFQRVEAVDYVKSTLCDSMTVALSSLVSRFDSEYYWMEREMCKDSDPRVQRLVIEKFIETANYCKALNNFFSLFTILGALDTVKVRNLREAWAGVSKESRKTLNKLLALTSTDRNMKAYRTLYRKCPPKSPRLPFLPMSLKDLRFVADGNSQSVNNLLNFDRLRILANYAVELASTTHIPFKKLKENEDLMLYLKQNSITNQQQSLADKRHQHLAEELTYKERFEKLRSEMYSLSHELSQKSVTIENLQLRVKEAENAVAKASTAQPNRRFIERIEERHSLELAAKNQRIFELEQQLERTQLKLSQLEDERMLLQSEGWRHSRASFDIPFEDIVDQGEDGGAANISTGDLMVTLDRPAGVYTPVPDGDAEDGQSVRLAIPHSSITTTSDIGSEDAAFAVSPLSQTDAFKLDAPESTESTMPGPDATVAVPPAAMEMVQARTTTGPPPAAHQQQQRMTPVVININNTPNGKRVVMLGSEDGGADKGTAVDDVASESELAETLSKLIADAFSSPAPLPPLNFVVEDGDSNHGSSKGSCETRAQSTIAAAAKNAGDRASRSSSQASPDSRSRRSTPSRSPSRSPARGARARTAAKGGRAANASTAPSSKSKGSTSAGKSKSATGPPSASNKRSSAASARTGTTPRASGSSATSSATSNTTPRTRGVASRVDSGLRRAASPSSPAVPPPAPSTPVHNPRVFPGPKKSSTQSPRHRNDSYWSAQMTPLSSLSRRGSPAATQTVRPLSPKERSPLCKIPVRSPAQGDSPADSVC